VSDSGFHNEAGLAALGLASYGADVKIDAAARFYGAGRIELGSHVRIDAFTVLSAGEGGIRIGSRVHIAAFGFMAGAGPIELEDFANISGRVSIYSSNDDYTGAALTGPTIPDELCDVQVAPVRICRHAIIGAGSVILPGVTIGEGAAVGALSIVKRDVEPFTIVAGPDARVIGERKRDLLELESRLDD
jgi:dTDP-4-amino-4,6-dideoxy-D-glucose acyltransferase